MLDSEPNNHETDINKATGHSAGDAPAPVTPAVPAALFQPPQVLFQPPAPPPAPPADDRDSGGRDSGARDSGGRAEAEGEPGRAVRKTRSRSRRGRDTGPDDDLFYAEPADAAGAIAEADAADSDAADVTESGYASAADGEEPASGRRRRRRTRTRGRADSAADADGDGQPDSGDTDSDDAGESSAEGDFDAGGEAGALGRRRRRKRRRGLADADMPSPDDPPDTVVHVREPHNPADDVRAIKGSTRLEAKKQRRREGRESGRRRPPVITESEFLARRESVDRTMVVRQRGDRTQIAVLEDGVLVEHYVNRTTHASYVGNVYLGKVQNVLPSMEAAFVDIGKGRNAVLYAGEVNFDASGLEGQPKRIESALKPGQSVIVQVTKDPVGHKGARLTSQISLPGRYLVYVPGASMTGISRKLPDTERTRLKQILKKVTPGSAGVIVRTAAEGAAEAELERDITRLAAQWENIEKKSKTASAPALLYGEPDLTIRVVRDVFNEDFNKLIVSGEDGWEIIDEYVKYVAPNLADRLNRWEDGEGPAEDDVFAAYRVDEQLAKALERKVWLPSGGSLVIDRTEAMTVIDVNTGKFTGQGGNLEETVTRNNLEAAEEIVRQLRLRDVGGIVVIDFIDMVLESNRELVLRRLLECLARDRTKHQVAEVTSLGLVQMTRKRVGAGLLEAFSQPCECCNGRGLLITLDAPAESAHRASAGPGSVSTGRRPVPAPPPGAPANGNGSASSRPGFGNGRRNRRDEERATADDLPAASPADTEPAPTSASPGLADLEQADTAPAAANAAATGNDTAAETDANDGRRTRRSTSAGTAFATAVLVDDAPPLVPVVTSVPPVSDPAVSAVTGAEATEPADPPVRRTRAGSAVARVTVVTEPEPLLSPVPSPEPASETAEAPAADTADQPADTAAAATDLLPPPEGAPTEAAAEAAAEAAELAAATEPASVAEPAAALEPIVSPEPVAVAEPAAVANEAGPTADLETPVADALEQAAEVQSQLETDPESAVSANEDLEVPTADAVEQATEVQATADPEPAAALVDEDLEAPAADADEQAPEAEAPAEPEPAPVVPPLTEPTIVPADVFEAPAPLFEAPAPLFEAPAPLAEAAPAPEAAATPEAAAAEVAADQGEAHTALADAEAEPSAEATPQPAAALWPATDEPALELAGPTEVTVEAPQAATVTEDGAPEQTDAAAEATTTTGPAADAEGEASTWWA